MVVFAVDEWLVGPLRPSGALAAVLLSWAMLAPLAWWAVRLLRRVERSFAVASPSPSRQEPTV